MRIAVDMSHSRKIKTGIRTQTDNMLKTLKKLSNNEFIYYHAPTYFKKKNFFTRAINAVLDFLWRQITLPRKISKENIDILYCPSFYTPYYSKTPVVAVIHDIIFLHYPKEHGVFWNSYLKFSTYIAVKKANKIITISEFSKKDILEKYKVSPIKIKVISNAVSQEFRVIKDDSLISKFRNKYSLKHKFFMYAGAVSTHKNIPTLLKSFYLFKKSRNNFEKEKFSLILSGSDKTPPENIQILLKKYNLEKDVIFIGFLPEDDLIMLYNTAEIFIFPSLYEGFGFPPLEAMACGCPVISSNATSLPEVLGSAGILVDPLDAEGIALNIENILSDQDLKNNLIEKGLNHVKNFSWDKAAEETLSIFKELKK